jgi:hypothetical protein
VTDDPARTSTVRDVQYRGEPLDAARGPGLGCFWVQLVALAVLLVLTPLSVSWRWPTELSVALLVVLLILLLFAGQTVIFLLRLVAADRRAAGRRRPLASRTKTVGELEDERVVEHVSTTGEAAHETAEVTDEPAQATDEPAAGDSVRE